MATPDFSDRLRTEYTKFGGKPGEFASWRPVFVEQVRRGNTSAASILEDVTREVKKTAIAPASAQGAASGTTAIAPVEEGFSFLRLVFSPRTRFPYVYCVRVPPFTTRTPPKKI